MILHNENNYDVKQDNSITVSKHVVGPTTQNHRWCVAVGPTVDCCLDLLDIKYHVG